MARDAPHAASGGGLLALGDDVLMLIYWSLFDPRKCMTLANACIALRRALMRLLPQLAAHHKERVTQMCAVAHSFVYQHSSHGPVLHCEQSPATLFKVRSLFFRNAGDVTDMAALNSVMYCMPFLLTLSITHMRFGSEGFEQLFCALDQSAVTSLIKLSIADTAFDARGAEAFARAVHGGAFGSVRTLDLGHNPMDITMVRALRAPLRRLSMRGRHAASGVEHRGLITLGMVHCALSDEGIVELFGATELQTLRFLNLNKNTDITATGIAAITSAVEDRTMPDIAMVDVENPSQCTMQAAAVRRMNTAVRRCEPASQQQQLARGCEGWDATCSRGSDGPTLLLHGTAPVNEKELFRSTAWRRR